jgi:O-antigen ligase
MSAYFQRSLSQRLLFAGFLGLILWAPIPLGSNRPWGWAILELWVFALAAWWLVEFARGRVELPSAFRRAWPALLCLALWLAYVWLQLLPLPPEWLAFLSPEAARWHADAAWPAQHVWAPLSLDQYATREGALKTAAYVGFFALTLALLDRQERIVATGATLVISGFLQAMYGGLTALAGGPGDVAEGSFVNRNHFAGYLEMCLSMGLGLLVGSLTGESARSWRQFLRNTLAWILSPRMQLRLALVIMVIALVLSRSRMGNSAFFISMLVTGVIALVLSRHATRSMLVLITTLVIIDIALVGAYFGVERVVERIEQTQIQDERTEVVQALEVWRDYPVFGSGLGSFRVVFPRYRGEGLSELPTHAHNDYVEFASEAGVVGIALLGLLVLMSLGAALRAQAVRHDPLMRGISFGAMMGIIALMIHSTVDFNLQIPANALTFMLLLAFAWISLHHRQR